MKIMHWAAIVVLALLTLMNLGAIGGDSPAGVVIFGIVLGLAGLIALYGMIRRTSWGSMAGLIVCVLNALSAVVGLIAGWDGWQIGLGVSIVALILTAVAESGALRGRGAVAAS